jgi:hypothetical protein
MVRDKDIPVTGRGDPYVYETSRLPHFLNDRLIDGGEVVSLTRQPPFNPQEDSWHSFLLELTREWSDPTCRNLPWIDVAQDRDQWRALVNTVLNLRVP